GVPLPPRGASPFPPGTGPSRLIVMRHAEKSGDKRDPHLSLPGRKRAEHLVEYIPATFGQPHFLIAARTSSRSRRPVETLEPLAAALALEVRAKFDDDDVDDIVEALRDKQRHRGKLGVICWRHSELAGLVQALGAAPDAYPDPWDENDYTTIIDLTYPGNGEVTARRIRMPD
ncbi:MAG: histidine phosphatase family protein, partial [Hyphomicrobiaceae bacterium]|nr:histidine phosphatase family protein [Hyphomicrobiaceae bacterium]